jgi:hypothetical protein
MVDAIHRLICSRAGRGPAAVFLLMPWAVREVVGPCKRLLDVLRFLLGCPAANSISENGAHQCRFVSDVSPEKGNALQNDVTRYAETDTFVGPSHRCDTI